MYIYVYIYIFFFTFYFLFVLFFSFIYLLNVMRLCGFLLTQGLTLQLFSPCKLYKLLQLDSNPQPLMVVTINGQPLMQPLMASLAKWLSVRL